MNLIVTCARHLENETKEELKNILSEFGDSEAEITNGVIIKRTQGKRTVEEADGGRFGTSKKGGRATAGTSAAGRREACTVTTAGRTTDQHNAETAR